MGFKSENVLKSIVISNVNKSALLEAYEPRVSHLMFHLWCIMASRKMNFEPDYEQKMVKLVW